MNADRETASGDDRDGAPLQGAGPDADASASSAKGQPSAETTVDRHTAAGPLLRPPPPLAKRLNRNALTVAAALAGVTVLTVVVVTNPSRSMSAGGVQVSASADASPPVPARPAFLDQPVKALPIPRAGMQAGTMGTRSPRPPAPGAARALGQSAPLTTDVAPGMLPVPPVVSGQEVAPQSIDPGFTTVSGVGAGGASTRAQAYQAALTSSVLVGTVSRRRPFAERSLGNEAWDASSVMPPPLRFPVPGSGQSEPPHSESSFSERVGSVPGSVTGPVPTRQSSDVGGSAALAGVETPSQLDPAGSPYTLRAGTVIAGLLITAVNSDLPGEVLGQTSRDVYDSRTQQVLLVPRGSRLIGSYDNRSVGTGRLIVTWSRLIFPDGRSTLLPHLAGTDGQGQAGLHDQIDHHYGRVYGAALLTSVLAAGVQLSQPQQSGLYGAPSSRQVAAGALGQTMGDVSLESARRGLDVLPTIAIRQGQPFNVFLSGDLVFDAPYVPETAVGTP